MVKINNGCVFVNNTKLGYAKETYIKVIRNESKHTFWKYKAWSINKELVDYAILTGKKLVVLSTHKSGETANYIISAEAVAKFIANYDCVFDYKGELQYVIPKTFFDYKREYEMVYTPATNIAPDNMHTKSVSINGIEDSKRQSTYI